MNRLHVVLLCSLMTYSLFVHADSLTPQEKIDFVKSSSASCIAKNKAGRVLTKEQKTGVQEYCVCQSSVMTSLVTREEMLEVGKGKLPPTLTAKVLEARKQCLDALLE